MAGSKENRTEKPTPRKLQKSREKGQIARSKEVSSALVLLGALLFLAYAGQGMLRALAMEMHEILRLRVPSELSPAFVSQLAQTSAARIGAVVAPFMLTLVAMGIAANLMQGGLTFSWHSLGFRVEKLNPKQGLSRIFSKNGIVELVKNLALLVVVAYVSYSVVIEYLPLYPRLVLMDTRGLLYWTATISFNVFLRVALFLALLAVADYAFQRYRFREQLKMTKQEVKDEHKEMEGDPLTRGRIRRIQREMARKRMMADVPRADVVITNPTHYSVALSYKMDTMEAPTVVAKGVGYLALKIREIAQKHDIPLVENKPLAQTLYKTVEVGQTIPAHLYRAVAEILAYIYKARNAWSR